MRMKREVWPVLRRRKGTGSCSPESHNSVTAPEFALLLLQVIFTVFKSSACKDPSRSGPPPLQSEYVGDNAGRDKTGKGESEHGT